MGARERAVRAALVIADLGALLYTHHDPDHTGGHALALLFVGILVAIGAIAYLLGSRGRWVEEGWFLNGLWWSWIATFELVSTPLPKHGLVMVFGAIAIVCFVRWGDAREERAHE